MSVFVPVLEVNIINKQKFLAELNKLLTFMYEEDRKQAIAAYSAMFDAATDEQALMAQLNSPLRQAVVVARAYNAERKLQGSSETKGSAAPADGSEPDFMRVIGEIWTEALSNQPTRGDVNEDQFSLFDEASAAAAKDMSFYGVNEESEEQPEEAEPVEEHVEESAASEGEDSAAVESFIEAIELPEEAEKSSAPAEESRVQPVSRTVRKPRVLLLLLYIIFAIPITLLGIVLLLIPTVLSLSMAAGLISVGVLVLSAAFGSFAILADLLVVIGCALILLALGLFFLWLFIWFIGGAIGGLVRGVVDLGGRWCYKEVTVA